MLSSFIVLFIMLVSCNSKLIESKVESHFNLEVGAALQQRIPILFRNFQHSLIKEVKRKADHQSEKICEIRLAEKGILRLVNAISYNFTGPTQQEIEDQIVYDLNALRSLKIFVDAIYFQQKLIALFQKNQAIIYSVNLENGLITQDFLVTMDDVGSLDDAKLSIFNNVCFIITPRSIGYIRVNGEYNFFVNLTAASEYTIAGSVEMKNLFLVAAGESGLITYFYHPETSSIDEIHRTTFQFKNSFIQADFSVDELFLDKYSKEIYILDHEEGLLQTNVSEAQQNNHVIVTDKKLLVGGCYNLIVTAYHVYLTCPELIQISRDSFLITKAISNSFFPYSVKYAHERLFLFGRQQFAIFDIFGQLIEEHALSIHSQKSFNIGNYLITFTNTQVISSSIISQREELYCHTNDVTMEGQYSGIYKSQGLCRQYYSSPLNITDICFVEYPFTLSIIDSAPANYALEVGLLVGWIVIMVVGICYCTIKYIMIHRGYNLTLVEEDTTDQFKVTKKDSEIKKEAEVS